MEEDIKILEKYLKVGIFLNNRGCQALENLLKGYRKLEEELKREKIWRIRLEKENEDTCNEVNNNYIRKSLVIPKSKIKEIRDKAEVMDYYTLPDVIDDLNKLLGEELMEDK